MVDIRLKYWSTGASGDYPFFFPTLFGSGEDGDLALTTNSDVGYLGNYGAKRATNATLEADQTLTIAQGTSSGALIIGCTGKLTIAGTINGSGQSGSNATASGAASGKGGDTAGGGVGGGSITTDTANGAVGLAPTKFGHGANQKVNAIGHGAPSGGRNSVASGQAHGNVIFAPRIDTSATYNMAASLQHRLIQPSNGNVLVDLAGLITTPGTSAANGTTAPINPTTNDVGPWAQTASGLFLPLGFIPAGSPGFGGGVTADGSGNDAAGGGGGGGGGVVIFEAKTIELVSGYAINLIGGNGGNGATQGGASTAMGGGGGWGGLVLLICRTLIGSTAAINCNGGSPGIGAGAGVASNLSGIAGGFYVIKV